MKRLFPVFTLVLLVGLTACKEAEQYQGTDTVGETEATQPITRIHFFQTLNDFGDVPEGQTVSHKFEFQNMGKYPLQITQVKPSCGCTTPDWSKKPVPPGGKGFVEVTFDSNGRPGAFTKTVRVMANTDPAENILTFKGEVLPKQ